MNGFRRHKKGLTRNEASDTARFLMVCYHEGVYDACNVDDNIFCAQFVAQHKSREYLGVLDKDRMSIKEYGFSLLIYARKYSMPTYGQGVLMNLTDNTALYGLCQSFYTQGVKDYICNPDLDRMVDFQRDVWEMWKEGHRQTTREVVKRVQELCVGSKKLVEFGYQLWLLTRPIGSGLKV